MSGESSNLEGQATGKGRRELHWSYDPLARTPGLDPERTASSAAGDRG